MAHRIEKVMDIFISLAFYLYQKLSTLIKNVKGCSKKKSIFSDNIEDNKGGIPLKDDQEISMLE